MEVDIGKEEGPDQDKAELRSYVRQQEVAIPGRSVN
jgi:hypothetical protein